MTQTGDQGVYFMMADDRFSVGGQKNFHEFCNETDLFTSLSAGLVYIM